MKLNIKRMNYEKANEISKWIYQEPYSIYSNDGSDSCIRELLDILERVTKKLLHH